MNVGAATGEARGASINGTSSEAPDLFTTVSVFISTLKSCSCTSGIDQAAGNTALCGIKLDMCFDPKRLRI